MIKKTFNRKIENSKLLRNSFKIYSIMLFTIFIFSIINVNANLIGEWKLENNTKDSSGNNNDGILIGGNFYQDNRSYLILNGINDLVLVNNSGIYNGLTKATWNIWVKQNSYVENAALIGKYEAVNGKRSFLIRTGMYDGISILLYGDGSGTNTYSSITNKKCGIRQNNEWTMITIVYDGTRIEYYRNGLKCDEDSTNITKIASTINPLTFGSGNKIFFNGAIDDIQFYDNNLNKEEILRLYEPNTKNQFSIKLNGVNSEVTAKNIQLFNKTSKASWNMWIKQNNYIDRAGVMGIYENGKGNRSFLIRTVLNDSMSVVLSEDGSFGQPHTSITNKKCGVTRNNEWTMITIIYSENKIDYYKNAELCDTDYTNISALYGTKIPINFGGANKIYFYGDIDEFKIYENSLDLYQIKRLFDESPHGKSLGKSIAALLYHQIKENATENDMVNKTNFAEQMEYLYKSGFTPIRIQDYNNWKNNNFEMPKNPILITFDDGWKSIFDIGFPIMNLYNMIGTMFINSDYANHYSGGSSYSSWSELNIMKDKGWGMESHGVSHVNMVNLTEAEFRAQLIQSKANITEHMNYTPTSFVFPYHSANQNYTTICGEYYDLCWTRGSDADKPFYLYNSLNGKMHSTLRRITVAYDTTIDVFKNLLGRDTNIDGDWEMNEGEGNITKDNSINENHGALSNGAAWS